jgi:hypothetical protein
MKYDSTTISGLRWAVLIEVRDAYAWKPGPCLPGVPESAIPGARGPGGGGATAAVADGDHRGGGGARPAGGDTDGDDHGPRASEGSSASDGVRGSMWRGAGVDAGDRDALSGTTCEWSRPDVSARGAAARPATRGRSPPGRGRGRSASAARWT